MNPSTINQYIQETASIDYSAPIIQAEIERLKKQSSTELEYIENVYNFVRDEIPHSWDIRAEVVSTKASEVLENRTGICWTKSCLLAALLRGNNIPAGLSFQKLTRGDDASEGYIIHALNTVYISGQRNWIRLDARGNKEGVCAEFSLTEEKIAFPAREEFGENDYRDNCADLPEGLQKILKESRSVLEVSSDGYTHSGTQNKIN